MAEKYRKVYVGVLAEFRVDGRVIPTAILWTDDITYPIDRVLDMKKAASRKVGGHGILYRVRIGQRETHLFREDEDRWFVEAREEGV